MWFDRLAANRGARCQARRRSVHQQVGVFTGTRAGPTPLSAEPDPDRTSAVVYRVASKDPLDVRPNGALCQAQTDRDLLVRQSVGDEADHFVLAGAEMDRCHGRTLNIGLGPGIGIDTYLSIS